MKIVYSNLSKNRVFATNVAFGRKYAILRQVLYQADYQRFESIQPHLTTSSHKKSLAFRRYSGGFSAILRWLFADTPVAFRRYSIAFSPILYSRIAESVNFYRWIAHIMASNNRHQLQRKPPASHSYSQNVPSSSVKFLGIKWTKRRLEAQGKQEDCDEQNTNY